MKTGRNDPCPCGSNKKYKHCCLSAEHQSRRSPEELSWTRVRRAIDDVPRLLGHFVHDLYGDAAHEEAWAEFLVWEGGDFDIESPLVPAFVPWMYHCWEPGGLDDTCVDESLHDRPPTRVFLERRGSRLEPMLSRYLEACLDAPFSFHEVRRCDPGHGFLARDVITGEEHEVLERSASETMQVGDILFGQLVPIDGIVLLEACSSCPLGPGDKVSIIALRRHVMEGRHAQTSPRDLLWDWEIELRELYLELVGRILNPVPPVLHNTDGELFLPQRLTFDIDSAETAFEGLKDLALVDSVDELLADAEHGADGRIERVELDWHKAGNRMHASWDNTVLGHLEITRTRLVAHVNSNERAETLRTIVAESLGAGARYLGSEAETLDQDAEHEPSPADDHEALMELPEVREHLERVIAAHYEDWLTQEIPALGNRRPIDAVQDADGREMVEALVSQMERDTKRPGAPPAEAALRRVRERLGLM